MQRCLELAELGRRTVAPNPMVGSVIVLDDRIVSEGWHRRPGTPHAEIHALNNLPEELRPRLPEATLFVNLEPCSHHGRTPPCAGAIIESGIGRVVLANEDPNPEVAGSGIEKLREAGIAVEQGMLDTEAAWLNRRFFTFHQQNRPYIILKWAATRDGFIGDLTKPKMKVSNHYSRKLTHKWRAEEDAIMVGTTSMLIDNPKLSVRFWEGAHPVRITLDLEGILPKTLNFFRPGPPTFIFSFEREESEGHLRYLKIDQSGDVPAQILSRLAAEGIQSLIIEGGTTLLQSFIDAGLWDEARIFRGAEYVRIGVRAPEIKVDQHHEAEILGDELTMVYRTTAPPAR